MFRTAAGRCFARSSKYDRGVLWLFTGPKRPTTGNANFFRAGSWRRRASLAGVAGGRRWRASLAGVAGEAAQKSAWLGKKKKFRLGKQNFMTSPWLTGWFFGNNFRSALFACKKRRVCLQTNNTKPPPAGFGGAMRRSRAITKKNMPFCAFFHVQPKHQNGAILVNIEGFRPRLSKPSYGASQWALVARLMQNDRPKSPQKSLF